MRWNAAGCAARDRAATRRPPQPFHTPNASTLSGKVLWTATYIYPALADAFAQLRTRLGKAEPPLNVVVTASGAIDPNLRMFQSSEVPVLVLTTSQGAQRRSAMQTVLIGGLAATAALMIARAIA